MRTRSPHGPTVLMGVMSLGARPPYAIAVLTALQSSWAPRPYGLPSPRDSDSLGPLTELQSLDHIFYFSSLLQATVLQIVVVSAFCTVPQVVTVVMLQVVVVRVIHII
jgi:hypothetical protein